MITPPHRAKLAVLSQSTALKLINKINEQPPNSARNQRAATNLRLIQQTLEDYLRISPPITTIWNTMLWMKRNAPPNIRSFLWKMLHRGLKIGRYWNNIPGYKNCRQCPECEQIEDMNHVLFVCPQNQGKTLWQAARNIFN